ncbi:Crotonyl-CoA reductase [Planctomycetes bacterium Pla86]|uniref:Crotonyl-CoA reductase n=2 Tax=Engelhardtia mirabilis TaxID=2528011 RepID=A0A518BQR9_9BACT|nr:Crotonyl-CoA reductase [Planctomycetes bacterium Pla133]QDV03648.1 Crotonyl-CoA reductase [Planctomycetes bacterium Pla86]
MNATQAPRTGETMRAVVQDRYGAAEVLELREIERPTAREGEVLVRVRAAGLDRGVWHLMAGLPYLVRLGFGLRRPKNPVPGMDLAGVVEAVGAGVTGLAPGDEVFGATDGSYAEFAVVKADRLAPKPARLSFEQAAAVPVSACAALHALRDVGEVQAGQRVLVIGASGGVGSFAVQLAKAFGAHVTGVCSTAKVDLVRSLGADHVIDYTTEDISTGGVRYDLVIDIAGNRSLGALRRVLTPRGTLVIVGGEQGDRWIGGTDRQLRAMALSRFVSQELRTFISSERREDLLVLRDLIDAGKVTPAVERTFPLERASEAMAWLEAGRARGKLVLTI